MAREVLGQGIFTIAFEGDTSGIAAFKSSTAGIKGPLGQISQALSGVNKGVANFNVNLKQAESTTSNMSQSLGQFSKDMFFLSFALGTVNTALIGLNKTVAQTAYGFDRNMTLVKAVTGATGDEFKNLSGLAREMGQASEFGATKAAEGLLILSRMGLEAADSMKVLEPAMKLAQSQQFGIKESTELVIQQLRVFNKEVEESGTFANVLAATSSKTAADLEKLQLALSYVGPVANAAGRSFEEVNAVLGIMFNAGIRASRAGTSLRFAFANLMNPTNRVQKALKAIGLTAKDVDPAVKNLNEIFVTLSDRLTGVQNKAAVLFDIFGKRAAPAMGAVVNAVMQNRTAFEDLQESITGTDEVQRQFEEQLASFSGQVNLLKTSFEEIGLQMGEVMMPMFRMLVGLVQDVTDWFKNLSPSVKEGIAFFVQFATVGVTLATSLAGIGWVLGQVGKAFLSMNQRAALSVKNFLDNRRAVGDLRDQYNAFQLTLKTTAAQTAAGTLAFSKRDEVTRKMIVNTAVMRASLEKNTAAQWEEFKATMRQMGALNGIKKAHIEASITAAQNALAHKGLTSAMNSGVAAAAGFGTALKGVGAALKGVFAALGGWVGLLITAVTFAIPAFITASAKSKAALEEQKRLAEENARALQQLGKEYGQVAKKISELEDQLKKEGKTSDQNKSIKKALTEQRHTEQKTIANIIQLFPELLEQYDQETGKLIVNTKLLAKYLEMKKLEIPVEAEIANMNRDEKIRYLEEQVRLEKDKLDFQTANLRLSKEAIKNEEDKLEVIKEQAAERKTSSLSTETGILGGPVIGPVANQAGQVAAQEAAIETQKQMYNEFGEQVGRTSKRLTDLRQALRDLWDEDGTSKVGDFTADLAGAGRGAKDTDTDIQALIDRLKRLQRQFDNMTGDFGLKIRSIQASDYEKGLINLEQDYEKTYAKIVEMSTRAAKDMANALTLKNEGQISTAQFEAAREEYDKTVEKSKESIAELKRFDEIRIEDYKVEFVKKFGRETENLRLKYRSELAKMDADWDQTLKSMNDETDATFHQMATVIQNKLVDIRKELAKAEAADSPFLPYIEALKQQIQSYERLAENLDRYRIEKHKENAITILKIEEGLQQDRVEASRAGSLAVLNQNQKTAKKIYEVYRDTYGDLHILTQKAFIEMEKSSSDFAIGVASTITDAFQDIFNTLSELGVIEDEAADMMNDFFGIIDTFFSEGYIAGIIEMVMWALEQIVIAIVDEVNSLDATGDYLTARFNRKSISTEAMVKLTRSTESLRWAFIDLEKTILGFGSSTNDVIKNMRMAWLDVAESIGLGSSSAAQALLEGINTIDIGRGATIDTGFRQDFLEGPESGSNRIMWMINWLNNIFQGGMTMEMPQEVDAYRGFIAALEQAGLVNMAAGITDEDALTEVLEQIATALQVEELLEIRRGMLDLSGVIADGNVTNEELIGKWTDVRDKLKGLSDKIDVFGDTVGREIGEDFVTAATSVFEKTKLKAEMTGDVDLMREAFETFRADLVWAIDTFGESLPFNTLMQLLDTVSGLDEEMASAIEGLAESNTQLKDAIDKLTEALDKDTSEIVKAFQNGAITFEEAMSTLDKLEDIFKNLPDGMGKEMMNSLRNVRIEVLETVEERRDKATGVTDKLESLQSKFDETIDELNEKMENTVETWQDLINERENLLNQFDKESQKLIDDSDDRVRALESERDALLGTFDFTENQNVRSRRFQQVAQIDKKITDEIAALNEKLADLEEKRLKQIEKINERLEELEEKYTNIEGVYLHFANLRNEAEEKYLRDLKEQYDILEKIGAIVKVPTLADLEVLSGVGWEKLGGFISHTVDQTNDWIDSLHGVIDTLDRLREEANAVLREEAFDITGSQAAGSGAQAAVFPSPSLNVKAGPSPNVPTPPTPALLAEGAPELTIDKANYGGGNKHTFEPRNVPTGKDVVGKYIQALKDFRTHVSSAFQSKPEDFAAYFKYVGELNQGGFGPYSNDLSWFSSPIGMDKVNGIFDFVNESGKLANSMWFALHSDPATQAAYQKLVLAQTEIHKNDPNYDYGSIFAQHGFSGMINRPTNFVVGEGNRPEFVSVTPAKDLGDLGNGILGGGQPLVIELHDHIDLRGAYGISSPQVAQKVWDQVWAPARRNSVNRIIDMRGRVQR